MQTIKNFFAGLWLAIVAIVQYAVSIVEWLKSFLSESDADPALKGKASNNRLLKTFIVVFFLYSYSKVSLQNKQLSDIPEYWLILILAIVAQKTLSEVITFLRERQAKLIQTAVKDQVQQAQQQQQQKPNE